MFCVKFSILIIVSCSLTLTASYNTQEGGTLEEFLTGIPKKKVGLTFVKIIFFQYHLYYFVNLLIDSYMISDITFCR